VEIVKKTKKKQQHYISLLSASPGGFVFQKFSYKFFAVDCRQIVYIKHTLQFTINKIVYKIFGAVSKDLYSEIRVYFGINSVDNNF